MVCLSLSMTCDADVSLVKDANGIILFIKVDPKISSSWVFKIPIVRFL